MTQIVLRERILRGKGVNGSRNQSPSYACDLHSHIIDFFPFLDLYIVDITLLHGLQPNK